MTLRLFAFVSLISMALTQSIVEYNITEEASPTVVLGNIIEDSELLRNLDSSLFMGATYEIEPLDNNNHVYFEMDNENVTYVQRLDREYVCPSVSNCNINLDVQIQTDINLYVVQVSITVLDINDNSPILLFPSRDNNTVIMPSFLPKDFIVARILARDRDVGVNAQFSYHIMSYNYEFYRDKWMFKLDNLTGILSMKVDHRVTQVRTMRVNIWVADSGRPQLFTQTDLYMVFNETMPESGDSNDGNDARISNMIGILSGFLLAILLVT